MKTLRRRPALLAFFALAAACATFGATRIGDILERPGDYDGRDVTVAGECAGAVNLLVVKAFTLRDATGEIVVVTQRTLPRDGERLRVKGRVNQAFKVAGKSLVVLIEPDER